MHHRPKGFIVKAKHNGLRLDQFVMALCPKLGRRTVQDLIKQGLVRSGTGHSVRAALRVIPGMIFQMPDHAGALKPIAVDPVHSPVVIAENDAFLVLSKPAGIAMYPAGNTRQKTVSDWISTTYPQIIGVGEDTNRPGIVHRLDRETSGLILIAKKTKSFMALKKLFHDRMIEKTYFALVYGHMSSPSGRIDSPIGRVASSKKRAVPAGKRQFDGNLRDASTEYELHTRYTAYDFLSVKPKTGRTHQIRVHLSALGHPIVGDRLYRFKEHRGDPLKPPFQLLHAGQLRFRIGRRQYHFEAPLPDYFRDTLKMLDGEVGRGYDWSA